MARPRAFDESEVLDRAMDVFCRHGYEGSSMAELCTAMGLNAPSVYAAFGSKRGLFDAVLKRYSVCEREKTEWVLSAPTAHDVIERMLRQAANQPPDTCGTPRSLLIHGGISAAPENADIPALLAQQRKANELRLRDRFDQAKNDGDLAADSDTAGLASYAMAVFDGIAVRAASGASPATLRKIVKHALTSLNLQAANRGESDTTAPTRGLPREFGATDALDAAIRVFWTKGYESASIADLTEAWLTWRRL